MNIKNFELSQDERKVVMFLEDGSLKEFDCTNPFGIFRFYEVMDQIGGQPDFHPVYTSTEAFLNHAKHTLFMHQLTETLAAEGIPTDPEVVTDRLIAKHSMTEAMKPGMLPSVIRKVCF